MGEDINKIIFHEEKGWFGLCYCCQIRILSGASPHYMMPAVPFGQNTEVLSKTPSLTEERFLPAPTKWLRLQCNASFIIPFTSPICCCCWQVQHCVHYCKGSLTGYLTFGLGLFNFREIYFCPISWKCKDSDLYFLVSSFYLDNEERKKARYMLWKLWSCYHTVCCNAVIQ